MVETWEGNCSLVAMLNFREYSLQILHSNLGDVFFFLPQMLAVKVDFRVVAYQAYWFDESLVMKAFFPLLKGARVVDLPLRDVEYAAFRDVMDVFVFCFWQRVLGSIQPPTTKNIYLLSSPHILLPSKSSDDLCYHFAVHFLPQEGVPPKKKDVTLRGTFFPKTNSKSPLANGRLKCHKPLLLEFVPLQRPG